jgi:cytochrome c peroxidase
MRKNIVTVTVVVAQLWLAAGACAAQGGFSGEPITPLPTTVDLDRAKVAIGETLFHDVRLSTDDSLACASCHDLATGGVDRLAASVGVGGQVGGINAPTVYNSGGNFKQFWDGRAATLEEQAAGPIHNPIEMGSSWTEAIPKLRADAELAAAVRSAYGTEITPAVVVDAIATFERSLITPFCRFDRFLMGEIDVLTDEEKEGYRLFKDFGCVACHQGANLGGNMFQVFGVMGDYFTDRGNPTKADLGRYNVTGEERDRHVFKVPSLRNIEKTPPYFHDASADTLEKGVEIMAWYQLGRRLDDREKRLIVLFLKTLTGNYRGEPLP